MIKLPWPPSINHYYAVVRGRKILSKRGRQYKIDSSVEMLRQGVSRHTSEKDRYCVVINANPPNKRKHDLDNLIKPILDALTDYGAIEDDSQVDDLRIQRFEIIKDGKIEVLVESYRT